MAALGIWRVERCRFPWRPGERWMIWFLGWAVGGVFPGLGFGLKDQGEPSGPSSRQWCYAGPGLGGTAFKDYYDPY